MMRLRTNAVLFTLSLLATAAQAAQSLAVDVYRDPNCGCCKAWIKHLTDAGLTVRDHPVPNMMEIKRELGVPLELASCHTGVVDGQFIEGHVPASDVQRMVGEKNSSDLRGLAVPGMPIGSPGMEMGAGNDAYRVIALTRDGSQNVFATYPGTLAQQPGNAPLR